MGLKSEFTKDTKLKKDALSSYPVDPFRVRCIDFIVTRFPRRLFTWLSLVRQEKIVSHPLFLRKILKHSNKSDIPANIKFGKADMDFLSKLTSNKESFSKDIYARRLQDGDICYYLLVDNQLISYNWINSRNCSIYCGFESEINFYPLQRNESVYSYDFYTYSKFRGKGYGGLLKRLMLNELYATGITELYTLVHYDSFASLKVHLHLGYRVTDIAYIYRLMTMTFVLWAGKRKTRQVNDWLTSLNL